MAVFSVAGRSVVVTGGSKGIGRGIASVFAEAGANVAVAARSAADIDAAVTALDTVGDGTVIGVTTDVSDPESGTAMAAVRTKATPRIFQERRHLLRSALRTARTATTAGRASWVRNAR